MVDVLAGNDGSDVGGLLSVSAGGGVLELGTLLRQTPLVLLGVVVVDLAVLNWDDVVVVSLREDLSVLDRLDRGVVVVLVNLLVDGG